MRPSLWLRPRRTAGVPVLGAKPAMHEPHAAALSAAAAEACEAAVTLSQGASVRAESV
jgi:hypothetical protein